MKEKILAIIAIFLFALTGCLNQDGGNEQKKMEPFEHISYYRSQYKERYQLYQKENPDLSDEEIVTYVNIGLDQPYYTNTRETPFLNTSYILSNKYLSMSESYVPLNLEQIDSSYTSGKRLLVREAKESFERMAQAAREEGYTIRAMSAYRSYQYQKDLYQRYVDQDGVENADTYSARPGFSEHQTGLVVDIDNAKTVYTKFETTKEFLWMQENASNYGFILRYPKGKEDITGYTYESWHYRYVGIDIAKKMKETGLTFDEYYVRYIEKEGN